MRMNTIFQYAFAVAAVALCAVCAPASAGAGIYPIPHLTGDADDWRDYLLVDNMDSEPARFTLILYADGVELSSDQLLIPGYAQQIVDIKQYASTAQCGLVIGDQDDNLRFRLAFENTIGGGVAEFALQDNTNFVQTFLFSDYVEAISWKGAGIANLGDQDAAVTFYGVGDGVVFISFGMVIPAKSNISGIHSFFLPAAAFDGVKKMVAVSDQPISGLVISGSAKQDLLLFTRAEGDTEFDYHTGLTQ